MLTAIVVGFAAPLIFNRTNQYAVAWLFTIIWLPGVSFLTYAMGTKAGLHLVYFTFTGVWHVMFGIERWRSVVALTVLAVVAFFLNEAWFDTPGLSGADETLVTIVRYTWIPNGFGIILVLGLYFYYQLRRTEISLEQEHERSERLLNNLLSQKIADRLKDQPDTIIADDLGGVSIQFADIVGFTSRASRLKAAEVVRILNQVFTEFDKLIDSYGLEKIKTIGDAYMVATGLPDPRSDHAEAVACLAFDMLDVCERLSAEFDEKVEVRIGIHTGSAVAGVIGTSKFFLRCLGRHCEYSCSHGKFWNARKDSDYQSDVGKSWRRLERNRKRPY